MRGKHDVRRCGCGSILAIREGCARCAASARAKLHAEGVATSERLEMPATPYWLDAVSSEEQSLVGRVGRRLSALQEQRDCADKVVRGALGMLKGEILVHASGWDTDRRRSLAHLLARVHGLLNTGLGWWYMHTPGGRHVAVVSDERVLRGMSIHRAIIEPCASREMRETVGKCIGRGSVPLPITLNAAEALAGRMPSQAEYMIRFDGSWRS